MIFICLLALLASGYSLPLDKILEENKGSLPDNVDVKHYNLQITIGNLNETEAFSGEVDILFSAKEEFDTLEIHAHPALTFIKVHLQRTDPIENPIPQIDVKWSNNPETEIVSIKPAADKVKFQQNFTYLLTISYTGKLDNDMDGFYKSSYKVGDEIHYLASTQFESTSARKAFPCFDEPQFKAQFKVTIICPDKYPIVLSNAKEISRRNTADSIITVEFEDTPKMSTYLLAFVISDFDCTGDKTNSVCSQLSNKDLQKLALETAPKVLEVMKSYTSFDYHNEMDHLQQVAIPDFSAGAMENWGLVTYREVELLWDEIDFSKNIKQKVVTVITHELSHQWFGDLVTLKWWDDTFLNEGFATYFEYHAANEIEDYKEMELDKQFVVEQVQTAFAIDTDKENTIHKEVHTGSEIQQHFDSISYNKGGSILKMVESFLGIDNFKKGLQTYIENNKESNTDASMLWNALNNVEEVDKKLPSKTTLNDVMDNWITKAGYPVISVTSNEDNITLTQTPFSNEVSDDTKWYVPITYTTSSEQGGTWLTNETNEISISLQNTDWVIVNDKGTGYYRVKYDEPLLNKLSDALSDTKKSSKIDELNKAQIVDDLMNLASIKEKEYKDIFKFFEFLKNEDSYYPWYSAISGFNNILKRIDDENIKQDLQTYILELTAKLQKQNICVFNKDSLTSKTHIQVLQKELASKWISDLGDKTCVEAANTEFKRYLNKKEEKVDPNYRSAVYCTAVRTDTNNFDELWNLYDTVSSAEQNIILKSLGCSSDEAKLKEYLTNVIAENSKVRKQDARTAFTAVQTGSKNGVMVVLDFIKSNSKEISTRLGETALNGYISSVADFITNDEQKTKLNDISNVEGITDVTKTTITNALKRVDKNLETTKNLESTFKEYFSSSANQNVIQYTTFISTIIVLMYQFL